MLAIGNAGVPNTYPVYVYNLYYFFNSACEGQRKAGYKSLIRTTKMNSKTANGFALHGETEIRIVRRESAVYGIRTLQLG